jgi:hypothetical protein
MGNVIPWSQIHPSVKSEEPFVAVVIIDPLREICVSEMVTFEPEALANPDLAAPELIAAAQAAAARVASGYRSRRKTTPAPTLTGRGGELLKSRKDPGGLRVLTGGVR